MTVNSAHAVLSAAFAYHAGRLPGGDRDSLDDPELSMIAENHLQAAIAEEHKAWAERKQHITTVETALKDLGLHIPFAKAGADPATKRVRNLNELLTNVICDNSTGSNTVQVRATR